MTDQRVVSNPASDAPASEPRRPAYVDALDEVRRSLERHARQHRGEPMTDVRQDLDDPIEPVALPEDAPLAQMARIFGLDPFERRVLMLCAGIELDGGFAALCGQAQPDPQQTYPTLGLALATLGDADWRALLPDSPLRYWRLVRTEPGHPLTTAPLSIDERILHLVLGMPSRDPRLMPWTQVLNAAGTLAPSEAKLADRIATTWRRAGNDLPLIQLLGSGLGRKRELAAAVGDQLGVEVHRLGVEVLPTNPGELDELVRLWRREIRLSRAVLLLEADELRGEDTARNAALDVLIDRVDGALLVSVGERLPARHRPSLTFEVDKPPLPEQRDAWHAEVLRAFGDAVVAHPTMAQRIEDLTQQFDLDPRQIRSACLDARGALGNDAFRGPGEAEAPTADDLASRTGTELWTSCRRQARPRLEDLASVTVPNIRREDLVLHRVARRKLDEILLHVRQRSRVHGEWGFGARTAGRARGLSALFAGPSGTGKTMAAEVLAGELELDLCRVDLSSVVSKYIGETEKNLRRVFDAAEEGGAVLLFDEADALFGKRSEVKDSHDRHANVEVSYLLQRMEAYRGVAILTSNLKDALDPAFLRRLSFIIDFPFPAKAEREMIWRRSFPDDVPLGDVRFDRLARLRLTGGDIKNVVLHAAVLAAGAANGDGRVEMRHLLAAARREHAKIGRPLPENDVR
ncbi:MAG: ATP-binding protein, partial [Acidobacteriota bacterium]